MKILYPLIAIGVIVSIGIVLYSQNLTVHNEVANTATNEVKENSGSVNDSENTLGIKANVGYFFNSTAILCLSQHCNGALTKLLVYSYNPVRVFDYNVCQGDECVNGNANGIVIRSNQTIEHQPQKWSSVSIAIPYAWQVGDGVSINLKVASNDTNSTYVDLGKSKILPFNCNELGC